MFGIDFDLSLGLKIGIKNIFYKVACSYTAGAEYGNAKLFFLQF